MLQRESQLVIEGAGAGGFRDRLRRREEYFWGPRDWGTKGGRKRQALDEGVPGEEWPREAEEETKKRDDEIRQRLLQQQIEEGERKKKAEEEEEKRRAEVEQEQRRLEEEEKEIEEGRGCPPTRVGLA